MKKIFLSLSLLLFTGSLMMAQQAVQGRYALSKKVADQAPGLAILLDGSAEYVEAAMAEKFKAYTKSKPKNMGKGLQMYEAVVMPEISDATLNYYYRIEEGGNSNDRMTKVTFFISPGHDNFYTADKYSSELNAAERMLAGLDRGVQRMQMQAAIDAQMAVVAEEEKRQAELEKEAKQLEKERENMRKEIEKLEKKLVDNEKAMENNKDTAEGQQFKIAKEVEKLQQLRKQMGDFK